MYLEVWCPVRVDIPKINLQPYLTLRFAIYQHYQTSDEKLDNDDKVLTANTVNSFQRAWATPERANNVPHFLLHHDYFNLLRGACAQH